MDNNRPLEFDKYYHIYNRGINGENLFAENDNYLYFMELYYVHINPVAETLAFCLMKNHFHFLIHIFPEEEIKSITRKVGDTRKFCQIKKYNPSRQFANLFNAYAKAFNKRNRRTGGLFETPFRRIKVRDDHHLKELVRYIHNNPVKHGFVKSITEYPWSSYSDITSSDKSESIGKNVIDLFGSMEEFLEFQNRDFSETDIESF